MGVGFEELVCQLAALETAPGVPFHRKGAGADAGLECYRVESDGSETGWQAKYFFELGSNEAAQLTKSFNQAVARHPQLGRFIVSLPFNLSDGRVGNRISERDRWNRWMQARIKAIAPRTIVIELLDETQFIERLSRTEPRYAGRRHYWFDLLHFTPDWFPNALHDHSPGARHALHARTQHRAPNPLWSARDCTRPELHRELDPPRRRYR